MSVHISSYQAHSVTLYAQQKLAHVQENRRSSEETELSESTKTTQTDTMKIKEKFGMKTNENLQES